MDQRPVVSDLDFSSIKEDMIEYFKERPEFADYEFSGSSLNLLMDILAYNTHYNALTANFQSPWRPHSSSYIYVTHECSILLILTMLVLG